MDRREVENWFEHGALSRVMERRTHGVTPDWLMSELVRRPGEVNRNAATSLTARTDQPTEDDPGAGEWHGATHHMVPAAPKFDPAYVRHWVDEAERYRYFQQSLAADESHEDIERQRRLWVVALKSPCMDEWERVCFVTGQAIARSVPAGAKVLLPESDLEVHLAAAGASHTPFVYFDAPEKSVGAIEELEHQRSLGVRYITFTKYGFWWLEIYEDFARHLRSRYRAIEETSDYMLFDLRNAAGHEGSRTP